MNHHQGLDSHLPGINKIFEAAIDQVTDGMVVLDDAWRYTYVSPKAARTIGRPSDALMGRCAWELFPDVEPQLRPHFESARVSGEPCRVQAFFPPPHDRWVECHCTVSANEMAITFKDVTEARRKDAELTGKNTLLNLISDISSDVIFAKDREGRLTFANPATLALVGKTSEEVMGLTDLEFLDDKLAAKQIMASDQRIMQSRSAEELEEVISTQGGRPRVWLSRKAPIEDAHGQVIGLMGISRDITERKNILEASRENEFRLRRIIEANPIGVVHGDISGRILDANQAFLRMIGRTRADLGAGAINWSELTPEEFRARDAKAMAEALEKGVSSVYEKEYQLQDGRRVPVLLACATYGGYGELVAFIADITERKAAEEKLRESDRRKSEFIAMLSHELRNPLAPIQNALHLIERLPPGSADVSKAVNIMRRQTQHLTHLIDDLLDITRISNGKIALQKTRVDLRDIVVKTTEDLRSVFMRAGVALMVEPMPEPIWVDVDVTRMTQVLGNLLNNSAKFTPAGGMAQVRVARYGDNAQVMLKDSGAGMEPHQIEKMFEPFMQAEQSLDRSKGGLGLGLALVKGLVQMHGGAIHAVSQGPGHGALFTVELPLANG